MAVHVLNLFVIPALKDTSVKEQVTLLQSFITNPIKVPPYTDLKYFQHFSSKFPPSFSKFSTFLLM